ncbi:MAG: DUF2256 domain-containing protein [Trueperaceae bacterium]
MPRRTAGARPAATKTCTVCGRPFADRGKWRRRGVFADVLYCSDACRREAARQRSAARRAGATPDPDPRP